MLCVCFVMSSRFKMLFLWKVRCQICSLIENSRFCFAHFVVFFLIFEGGKRSKELLISEINFEKQQIPTKMKLKTFHKIAPIFKNIVFFLFLKCNNTTTSMVIIEEIGDEVIH